MLTGHCFVHTVFGPPVCLNSCNNHCRLGDQPYKGDGGRHVTVLEGKAGNRDILFSHKLAIKPTGTLLRCFVTAIIIRVTFVYCEVTEDKNVL